MTFLGNFTHFLDKEVLDKWFAPTAFDEIKNTFSRAAVPGFSKGGSLGGRAVCLLAIPFHVLNMGLKPLIYTEFTVFAAIAFVTSCVATAALAVWRLVSNSETRLPEEFCPSSLLKLTLNLACSIIVSPFGQAAQIVKAVAGIIHPGAYFKKDNQENEMWNEANLNPVNNDKANVEENTFNPDKETIQRTNAVKALLDQIRDEVDFPPIIVGALIDYLSEEKQRAIAEEYQKSWPLKPRLFNNIYKGEWIPAHIENFTTYSEYYFSFLGSVEIYLNRYEEAKEHGISAGFLEAAVGSCIEMRLETSYKWFEEHRSKDMKSLDRLLEEAAGKFQDFDDDGKRFFHWVMKHKNSCEKGIETSIDPQKVISFIENMGYDMSWNKEEV